MYKGADNSTAVKFSPQSLFFCYFCTLSDPSHSFASCLIPSRDCSLQGALAQLLRTHGDSPQRAHSPQSLLVLLLTNGRHQLPSQSPLSISRCPPVRLRTRSASRLNAGPNTRIQYGTSFLPSFLVHMHCPHLLSLPLPKRIKTFWSRELPVPSPIHMLLLPSQQSGRDVSPT